MSDIRSKFNTVKTLAEILDDHLSSEFYEAARSVGKRLVSAVDECEIEMNSKPEEKSEAETEEEGSVVPTRKNGKVVENTPSPAQTEQKQVVVNTTKVVGKAPETTSTGGGKPAPTTSVNKTEPVKPVVKLGVKPMPVKKEGVTGGLI